MARAVEFRKAIEKLFRRRADRLLSILGGRPPGAPLLFGRRQVKRTIKKLQGLASASLATRLARKEFSKSVDKKKSWRVKGWGREEKKNSFNKWFDEHIPYKRCVYVFWKGKHCVYAGKTKGGAGRPSSHFEKYWFNGNTRIDIYALRGKRSLPTLECLAIHRFQPKENKNRAQSSKWTKKCPLCKVHKDIKSELQSIFRLRRGRRRNP